MDVVGTHYLTITKTMSVDAIECTMEVHEDEHSIDLMLCGALDHSTQGQDMFTGATLLPKSILFRAQERFEYGLDSTQKDSIKYFGCTRHQ